MAQFRVKESDLVLHLSPLEKFGALRGDLRVPLTSVSNLWACDDLWSELRGLTSPGTVIPGLCSLGTCRGRGTKDFAAVYPGGQGVVVELRDGAFARLLVSAASPSGQLGILADWVGG